VTRRPGPGRERGEDIQHVTPTDRLGRLERPSAAENGKSREQEALAVVQ
jgi:hypothetical protein